jgi:6-phosphofructokinase 1
MGITSTKRDESGNVKNLTQYGKQKYGMNLTIKYLNPTYAIRTTPANGADTDLCHRLAHVAVHCVMGGYTDFSVG